MMCLGKYMCDRSPFMYWFVFSRLVLLQNKAAKNSIAHYRAVINASTFFSSCAGIYHFFFSVSLIKIVNLICFLIDLHVFFAKVILRHIACVVLFATVAVT